MEKGWSWVSLVGRRLGGHSHAPYLIVLTVLGGLAEFEREFIRAAPAMEGSELVLAASTWAGQPKLTKHQEWDAPAALAEGSTTQADLARRFKVSQATISRLAQ